MVWRHIIVLLEISFATVLALYPRSLPYRFSGRCHIRPTAWAESQIFVSLQQSSPFGGIRKSRPGGLVKQLKSLFKKVGIAKQGRGRRNDLPANKQG